MQTPENNDQPVETIELPDEITPQDEADLEAMFAEGKAPEFHPILQVWRDVLEPAADVSLEQISPRWANKVVTSYTQVSYADTVIVQRRYYEYVEELRQILLAEIAKDKECLTYLTPEDDREHNAKHYKDLAIAWQVRFLEWELGWDPTHPHAAAELAAMSEVHKMFLGEMGLLPMLQNIKFEFTEEDQVELIEKLEALKPDNESTPEVVGSE